MKVVIAGASGRMGKTLIEAVSGAADMRLHNALDRTGSPLLGRDAGELAGAPLDVGITDDVAAALAGADTLIDFTRPEATLRHLAICREKGVAAVIGTTGFDAAGIGTFESGAFEHTFTARPVFVFKDALQRETEKAALLESYGRAGLAVEGAVALPALGYSEEEQQRLLQVDAVNGVAQ